MKVAKSKFVHNYCIPNALFTLKEYLIDYASPEAREKGERTIAEHLEKIKGEPVYEQVAETLRRIEDGDRDLRL